MLALGMHIMVAFLTAAINQTQTSIMLLSWQATVKKTDKNIG